MSPGQCLNEATKCEAMAAVCSYAPDKARLLAAAAEWRKMAVRFDAPDCPPASGGRAAFLGRMLAAVGGRITPGRSVGRRGSKAEQRYKISVEADD